MTRVSTGVACAWSAVQPKSSRSSAVDVVGSRVACGIAASTQAAAPPRRLTNCTKALASASCPASRQRAASSRTQGMRISSWVANTAAITS